MVRQAALAVGLAWLAGCGGNKATAPTPTPPIAAVEFVGAGDIALCDDLTAAYATAKLLDVTSGTVFTTGDNVYYSGTIDNFRRCYDPTWGRHLDRTRPTLGNHEYEDPGAAGYFAYFGSNAGPDNLGYYSYNLGTWHVIALNNYVAAGPGSAQLDWLAADLRANPTACTVAYWHHPLFSSGPNGPSLKMQEVWRLLYAHRVEIVLNGHDHLYERFGLQDPDGLPDPAGGIRQFTVGTGGAPLYQFARVSPNSEARASVYGVLKLSLGIGTYSWEFVPIAGQSFRDAGTGTCH